MNVSKGKNGEDPYSSETSEELLTKPTKIQKPNEHEDHEQGTGRPRAIPTYWNGCKSSENILWMTEFLNTHASSSHGFSLEPARSADLGKHREKITRAPWRRRIGRVVLRVENFGDLITADHQVLSEGCEYRNNHRYAVVVQELATQWIQSYSLQNKNFTGNPEKACKSSWSQIGSLKSLTLTIPWNLTKACEDLSWIHCTSTPHRSETKWDC